MNKKQTSNITTSKSTRKFKLIRILVTCFSILLVVVPIYSVNKYSKILLSTPLASGNSPADCGVVLTGAAGRIREGIAILSQKQIKKLIISGVHQHSTLSDMFPEILFYPEIKLENVILERRSNSTAGNAQQSLTIVEALQCQSVLLITSDYHMFRALKTFAQVFPPAIQIIPYSIPSERLRMKPGLLNTRFWSTVFEEWYKYLFYEVFVY